MNLVTMYVMLSIFILLAGTGWCGGWRTRGVLLVRGLVRQSRQPQRRDARVPEVHAGPGGGGVERRRLSETPGPEEGTPIAARTAGRCAGNILLGVPNLFRSAGGRAAAPM